MANSRVGRRVGWASHGPEQSWLEVALKALGLASQALVCSRVGPSSPGQTIGCKKVGWAGLGMGCARVGWARPWWHQGWLGTALVEPELAGHSPGGARVGWARPWWHQGWLGKALVAPGLAGHSLGGTSVGQARPW